MQAPSGRSSDVRFRSAGAERCRPEAGAPRRHVVQSVGVPAARGTRAESTGCKNPRSAARREYEKSGLARVTRLQECAAGGAPAGPKQVPLTVGKGQNHRRGSQQYAEERVGSGSRMGAASGPPHRCAPGQAAHRYGRRPRHADGAGRLRQGTDPPAPRRSRAGPRGCALPRRASAARPAGS